MSFFEFFKGSGKSTWMKKMLPELTEARPRPTITGVDHVIEQMKILGTGRYREPIGEKREKLAKMAKEVVNKLLKRAVEQNRDVIVDSYNIHPAERRKRYVEFQDQVELLIF